MSAATPRPGVTVAGSRSGRPIMAAFDLLSRRWTLRVVWELHVAGAPLTFRALRSACGEISSSVLTRRLAELGETAIVVHAGDGYALTATGLALVDSLAPLLDWSRAWAAGLDQASGGVEGSTRRSAPRSPS